MSTQNVGAPMHWIDWLAMSAFYAAIAAVLWAIVIMSAWPLIGASVVIGVVLLIGHSVPERES